MEWKSANEIFNSWVNIRSITPEIAENIISAMEEYANQWRPKYNQKLVWQFSTKQNPNYWNDATDEDYFKGKHFTRLTWRQVLK